MEGERRGSITRDGKGWKITPGAWSVPKALPVPDAVLEEGRIVRVTFHFVLDENRSREAVEEFVFDGLNCQFDLWGEPMLEDPGVRTDRPLLLEEVLSKSFPSQDRG